MDTHWRLEPSADTPPTGMGRPSTRVLTRCSPRPEAARWGGGGRPWLSVTVSHSQIVVDEAPFGGGLAKQPPHQAAPACVSHLFTWCSVGKLVRVSVKGGVHAGHRHSLELLRPLVPPSGGLCPSKGGSGPGNGWLSVCARGAMGTAGGGQGKSALQSSALSTGSWDVCQA